MFFEPRSKGVKAIRRRIGGSNATAKISASFETLEPRHCCAAVDDVFTKTAADFAPSADPNKNLVTSLDVLANDIARSGNKADLSIGVLLVSGNTTGPSGKGTNQNADTTNSGYLKLSRDTSGSITGIQYGLPVQSITSFKDYQGAENQLKNKVIAWGMREQSMINEYYFDVDEVLDRMETFVRDHVGSGAGWFASAGGSSLKDIGTAAIGLTSVPGAVLSVGGRAIELFLGACRNSQLHTLDSVISSAKQKANDARTADLDKAVSDFERLKNDLDTNCLQVDKQVFGNYSFVYSETDKSPILTPPSVPQQLGGSSASMAAASVRLTSSALVTINMNIEDYSAKLAHLNAWAASHDLVSHRYAKEVGGTVDMMYGDALIAFAGQAGFGVAFENGQWVGRDGFSGLPPQGYPADGGWEAGVNLSRWFTCDGLDVADELNKIKYKKK